MHVVIERSMRWLEGLLTLLLATSCGGIAVTDGLGGPGASSAGRPGAESGSGGAFSGAAGASFSGDAGQAPIGGSSTGVAGQANRAGAGSAGSAGEGPLDAVRFVLLEPPAPPFTPEGLAPDDERNFSTSYCCASADATVIVGTSTYVFPRFSSTPSGELTRAFMWREEAGLKDLGPISDPDHGFVASIAPAYLTADGSRVLGSYELAGVGPGVTEPVAWSTHLGGFFVWTESQGYTLFGPSAPMLSGRVYGFGADGKTALGYVEPDASSSLGFLWTEADGFSFLKDLPEWPAEGQPIAMSRDGSSILGIAGDSGFRWRKSGLQWLGTVGIWPVCRPETISADGAVIAGLCQNGSQAPITFRWSEASGAVALDVNSTVQILPAETSDRGDVLLGGACKPTGFSQGCVARGLAFLGKWR